MLKEHPWADPKIIEHCQLLRKNYLKYTNKELINYQLSDEEFSFFLFNAPFVIISHGTEGDPIFNYGNHEALKLWEMTWEEFTQMPSRLSAEPLERAERQKLLDETAKNGFIENFNAVRISKSGKKFLIKNVTLFNLYDGDGIYRGQAATFEKWEHL